MPPSPSLSARMTSDTYLRATTISRVHTTIDIAPITFARSTASGCSGLSNASRSEYSGLVSRSPYTTPSAPSASPTRPTSLRSPSAGASVTAAKLSLAFGIGCWAQRRHQRTESGPIDPTRSTHTRAHGRARRYVTSLTGFVTVDHRGGARGHDGPVAEPRRRGLV